MSNALQEKAPVRLKGVKDSLWVTFDPNLTEELIQTELVRLFDRLKHLSINARVILEPEDEGEHEKLIDRLGKFLKEKFDVGSVSAPPKKRSFDEERSRQRDVLRSWQNYRSDVLMLAGRVRSGQKVTARKHVLIMGDVNPGAEVIAGGDILILGSLCGTACAGQPENEEAIILALDFRPTLIQIGGFVGAGTSESTDKLPEFAHVEDGAIIVENYLKANPFSKIPWPEMR